jgi:glutaredoxin-like YruB-family protein
MIQLKNGFMIAFVIFLSCSVCWAADLYRWEDENGVVHYTDTPPGDASEWEEVGSAAAEQDTGETENTDPQRPAFDAQAITELLEELNDETEDDEEDDVPSVEIYTTSWCTYCNKAKSYLRKKDIAFVEYNIEKDREANRRMQTLTNSKAVPFAVINGQKIQGFSKSAYEQALKN